MCRHPGFHGRVIKAKLDFRLQLLGLPIGAVHFTTVAGLLDAGCVVVTVPHVWHDDGRHTEIQALGERTAWRRYPPLTVSPAIDTHTTRICEENSNMTKRISALDAIRKNVGEWDTAALTDATFIRWAG